MGTSGGFLSTLPPALSLEFVLALSSVDLTRVIYNYSGDFYLSELRSTEPRIVIYFEKSRPTIPTGLAKITSG